MTKIRPKDGN